MPERYHVLIENGTVVDGSGEPGFAASVGVRDGRLAVIRNETDELAAERRIDARGLVVSPGFIDLHSHSGLMIFADPLHEPKVRQGVTTEVIGVDGLSYAPIDDPNDLEALAEMNAGLDGRPDIAYDWSSVERYLDRLDALRPSLNLAYLVGNSALRIGAIGWDEAEATAAQVQDMRAMLREAMEQGAIGLSSGLDYPPGAYASTDELATLTSEAGLYHTHVRYALGDAIWTRSGRPSTSGGAAMAQHTSPTSIIGRRFRTVPDRCWPWSTMPGRKASTSRSTPIRTNGPAPGS